MADTSLDTFTLLLEGLKNENSGQPPSAEAVAEVTGLSVQEAQEVLNDCGVSEPAPPKPKRLKKLTAAQAAPAVEPTAPVAAPASPSPPAPATPEEDKAPAGPSVDRLETLPETQVDAPHSPDLETQLEKELESSSAKPAAVSPTPTLHYDKKRLQHCCLVNF